MKSKIQGQRLKKVVENNFRSAKIAATR